MLLIKNVLTPEIVKEAQRLLAGAKFFDGRGSAGAEASQVKNNEEIDPNSKVSAQLNQMVMGRLVQNAEYQAAVWPHRVASAFFVRYNPGMGYGFHVDDPVMGPATGRYRSDVSTTVFLNDDYDGGELVIRTPFGEEKVRGEPGDAVVYNAGSWHKVAEITRGTRLVAVSWAQSLIKDPVQRDLIHQLTRARKGIIDKMPQSDEAAAISTVHINLLRMWSEV